MTPHPETSRPGSSRRLPAVLAVGLAMVISQGLAAPTAAAPVPSSGQASAQAAATSSASSFDDGRYIVMLKDKPLATYSGGVPGIPGTAVPKGKKLNPSGPNSRKYDAHLRAKQRQAAAAKGVTINRSFTLAVNAFSAALSAAQVKGLASDSNVLAVVPDSMRKPDYSTSDFLGLPGSDGVWNEHFGGKRDAGKGVVVGMLDTGYSPKNPFFAGDEVKDLSGRPKVGEPFRLQGNVIGMQKANGGTFVGNCVSGDGFDGTECNSKVLGARFYDQAYKAAVPPEFRSPLEKFSPLDVNGHGSHTGSTAAGNSDVTQVAGGRDFGKSSGVAPAAKIAVYKVCWEGSVPEATGCLESDILNAIQDAVLDGVDVLNYSISGNNTSTVDAVSLAFLNAAAAGVFVATSAGNSGPFASTVNHAGPWLTSVAASTFDNSLRGTAELSNGAKFAGASVMSTEVRSKPIVLAVTVKAAAAVDANAALCAPDTLDPAKAAGKIVVCDRGVVPRVAKSDEVKRAGGVGMVLVNLTPGSLDADLHSVPTVHVDDPKIKDVVTANPGLTASLKATDTTGAKLPPVPQIAEFSSRGPTLASDGDLLKPDVTAPGVAVLAAVSPIGFKGEDFGFLSGTSMAAPHIAGSGALLLGKNPQWSPAAVKSAIMTTAHDLVKANGAAVHDVFAQGAGHVDPARFSSPGLVYDAGIADWMGFLQGQGFQLGLAPIAAKDVNLPSIALGAMAGSQTVTRTVTALTAGTYRAAISLPGITATVSPAEVTLAKGGKATFTVTFTTAGAPLETYSMGSLTWTSSENSVRSPVAVRPVAR
jgi:subtilisin family serine protease